MTCITAGNYFISGANCAVHKYGLIVSANVVVFIVYFYYFIWL